MVYAGGYQLLFASPEALLESDTWKNVIQLENLRALVIDEAHCILDWGLATDRTLPFRQAYGRLGVLVAQRPSLPVLALTASASLSLRKAIATSLGIWQPVYICGDLNRQNIFYELKKRKGDVELDFLQFAEDLKRLRGHMPRTIVYCRRLLDCGLLFEFLQMELGAQQYWPDDTPHVISRRIFHQFHRPLPSSDKELVLKLFMDPSSACRVIIRTVALGMGLDCPDIRCVIHYGVPASVESYYQESGRCGRDGVAATAMMFNEHDIKQEPQPVVCGKNSLSISANMTDVML